MRTMNKILIVLLILVGLAGISWWVLFRHRESPTYLTSQLFKAIEANDVNKAKELIEKGADVNSRRSTEDPRLSTPLFSAIRESSEMVELLLHKGAHPTEMAGGVTPLDESVDIALLYHSIASSAPRIPWIEVQKNQKKIIPLLMKVNASTKYPEIVLAVIKGDFARVKELFEKKEVNISNLGEISENPIDLARALMFANDKQITDYVIKRIPEVEVTMQKERPVFD